MSWVTAVWLVLGSACPTLAAVHAHVWLRQRQAIGNAAFAVLAASVAGMGYAETRMLLAGTTAEFGRMLWVYQFPVSTAAFAVVGFVLVYLRAGRAWLGWTAIGLRAVALMPRHEFINWTDDGQVAALRYDNLKVTFLEQKAHGLRVWQEPFSVLRAPLLANLRMDPFERAEEEHAMGCQRWYMERMYAFAPAGAYVSQWLQSFREFPPRQKPGSFKLERAMEAVTSGQGR